MNFFKRSLALVSVFAIAVFLFLPLSGARADNAPSRDITHECTITLGGAEIPSSLIDDNTATYLDFSSATIRIVSSEPIGGIYVRFDRTPTVWGLYYGENTTRRCGENGFLHEYQRIGEDGVKFVSLDFPSKISIADIFVLSKGEELPSFVQNWRSAEGECDIMLISCHSDDDQLFFAGAVPDAVARGAEMQVCFFTNHLDTHSRPHELLNGLWECGLDRYPIVSNVPDTGKTRSSEAALAALSEYGFTYESIVSYQVELLRKFKPRILLVHDIDGEYGHGAHILCSHATLDAVLASPSADKYPLCAEEYGTWDVKKAYVHLYDQATIDFEIDAPLDFFGGKSAFQVSQDAFLKHESQRNTTYYNWLYGGTEPITSARQIESYSPRSYGLWRSTVGDDTVKTDFYENIVLLNGETPSHTSVSPSPLPSETPTPTPTPEVIEESSAAPVASTTLPTPVVALIMLALLALAFIIVAIIMRVC